MAVINKIITNSKTGQSYKFLQTAKSTNGEYLEIESTFRAHSKEPPAHYHPHQSEDFIVRHGELTVKLDSEVKILRKGDKLHLAAGQVHSMWNGSESMTVVNWITRPALNSENLFETMVGLANDGQTDENGRPNLLQVALTVNRFSNVFRIVNPHLLFQKIIFNLLTPFAYLAGKRAVYKKYLD